LAVAFVDLDLDGLESVASLREGFAELFRQVAGELLGGRVGDRKEDAILAGEDPTPILERGRHFAVVGDDFDLRVLGGEQDVMTT
jgi:hypothetical protein